MGKYVRTKDGKIYELQETENGEKYLVKTNELIPLWNTKEYKILKEADTIEKLCDCKVVILSDGEHWQLTMPIEDIAKAACRKEVYGAIWTDKGLIYVAKMNEKGELELL